MNTRHSESRLSRRALLVRGGAAAATVAVCAVPFGWAQQSAGERWRLLVNEAVTADLSISMLAVRYRGWAEYMGSQIHNRQVLVDPIIDIQRFLQQALSEQKPLLVFGKSVNQLSKLVRDHGYQPLVRRPDPYKAAFIVPKDSPIQGFAQLAGRKLLLPDAHSATVAVARAEIRRQGIREPYMSHTRFQDSVAGQVASGMAEAGVVNPTIARKWQEGGGRIIGETQPVVNWSVLASPKASPDMVARLTDSLLAMNGQGGGLLADIGVKQWARADRKDYVALLEYTGE
jgi:ABC-type phosphate/phosphonate transport system substrate-binding protein